MMDSEREWLRPRLAEVFEAKWAGETLPERATLQDRFVFHVADAVDDVRRLGDMLTSGERPGAEELADVLGRFFLHAVPHLLAAGQLYDFVPEIFPEQKGVHDLEPGPGDPVG